MITLNVNGKPRKLDIPDDMPLLWTLRDVLNMTGTKFGCGMGLCGACTIHIDGQPTRSCITPVSAAAGKQITTIEAIGATPAGKKIQTRLARARRAAMRVLPIGPDHVCERAVSEQTQAKRLGHRRGDGGQHLPLRHLSAHPRRNQTGRRRHHGRACPTRSPARRCEMSTASIETHGAVSSSRRNFLKLTRNRCDRRRADARLRPSRTRRDSRRPHHRCAIRAERVFAHRSQRARSRS